MNPLNVSALSLGSHNVIKHLLMAF